MEKFVHYFLEEAGIRWTFSIASFTFILNQNTVTATVAPVSWNFKEIGSPFSVELCDCIKSKRDVYSDLVFNFDLQQVINVLGLGNALGQTLPLTMTGRMTEECDGRTYIQSITGKDCALIQR